MLVIIKYDKSILTREDPKVIVLERSKQEAWMERFLQLRLDGPCLAGFKLFGRVNLSCYPHDVSPQQVILLFGFIVMTSYDTQPRLLGFLLLLLGCGRFLRLLWWGQISPNFFCCKVDETGCPVWVSQATSNGDMPFIRLTREASLTN